MPKHLLKFDTERDYKTAKENHLILPNISSIVENSEIKITPRWTSREHSEAGDIIAYHKTGEVDGKVLYDEVRYFKPEAFDRYDHSWTADSIVVVPYSHTDDGTVRAMSLKYANCSTPANGGGSVGMMWGASVDNPYLTNYTTVGKFSSYNAQDDSSTYGTNGSAYLPSDDFRSGVENPYDWYSYYTDKTPIAPSPYDMIGRKNDAYHGLGEFSKITNNVLKDMNGAQNTYNILIQLNEKYLNETIFADTITNAQTKTVFDLSILPGGEEKKIEAITDTWYDEEGVKHTATEEQIGKTVQDFSKCNVSLNLYPAACACARHSSVLKPCTFDKENGKTYRDNNIEGRMPWYLPSAGELGYMIARCNRIKYGLSQTGVAIGLATSENHWSSSECSNDYAWYLRPSDGYVYGYYNKRYQYRVRPFAAF